MRPLRDERVSSGADEGQRDQRDGRLARKRQE